jgi:pectate lyase
LLSQQKINDVRKLIAKAGVSLFAVLACQQVYLQQPAFPGAEGYGKYATGGRGGRVIEVTSLYDEDRWGDPYHGSLRAALNTEGNDPITIVFRVSGIIALTSELRSDRPNVTIAGQTAPGEGICIKDNTVKLSGNNLIIRYLRFRPGDETRLQVSGLNIENAKNIIVDHCSFSWSIEENATFYDNKYTTVQWCILSEALYDSYHSKGPRGYAGQWGGQYASYHHNLLASCYSRSPRFNGSHSNDTFAVQDFRNNVIANYGQGSSIYGGGCEIFADTNSDGNNDAGSFINFLCNYLKPGPAYSGGIFVQPWRSREDVIPQGYAEWYIADNIIVGHADVTQDNWLGVDPSKVLYLDSIRVNMPHAVDSIHTVTADSAYTLVLEYAGAIRPIRDAVDLRIRDEVENGTGQIIDSQTEVGGWPEYGMPLEEDIPPDSDSDGMPDYWELDNDLNPNDPEDGKIISDDGYSNLEHYLNSDIPFIPAAPDISAEMKNEQLHVFPNPALDKISVVCDIIVARTELYDLHGNLLISEKTGKRSVSIDAGELKSGIYILKTYDESGNINSQKLMKQ